MNYYTIHGYVNRSFCLKKWLYKYIDKYESIVLIYFIHDPILINYVFSCGYQFQEYYIVTIFLH